ncbi:MAG: band 7 flotillin-like domain protein [Steroidobacteraceae bacterium]|nr:band 7 flotillin-like domain protein [Steroidobacteraceae bacterium]
MDLTMALVPVVSLVLVVFFTIIFLASRYKRCPSDKILVKYGKVGKGQSAQCIHGGGSFIWPLFQDYTYMSLTPLTIPIPLTKALSLQNIRVNVPSTFTVGISTEEAIMNNAAERLLNLAQDNVESMAREIIFGQLRLTVASLTIEQINQDREKFLDAIRRNVAPELNKIGLYLINVNITDITDESGYIESIGKKAASEAINQAKIDVSDQDRKGSIGEAEQVRERTIKVSQHLAESEKGKKQAEADQRIYVQKQETLATIGEAEAARDKEIKVAENEAESEKGQKKAEAEKRIFIQAQEAEAIAGENRSRALMAASNAELTVQAAQAAQRGQVAQYDAQAEIQKAQAKAELQRLTAAEVVKQQIEKQKITIAAEAEAEKTRREAQGVADATLLKYEAEAKGIRQVLEAKAQGYQALVQSANNDARAAATLLLTEKLEQIVTLQVEAIKAIKIDKITVWDAGAGANGSGGSTTANFLAGMVKSLPPLHDVAAMAGLELPKYLGDAKLPDLPASNGHGS